MREILKRLCDELHKGRSTALATIVLQEGSAPRGAGSRLLAGKDGLLCGTIGGGLVEAKVIKACAEACETGKTQMFNFDMDGNIAANSEMICGGKVNVLIEPFLPEQPFSKIMADKAKWAAGGNGGILARELPNNQNSGLSWTLLYDNGAVCGSPVSEETAAMLRSAPRNAIITAAGKQYFCERCEPGERMIIVGGGHVSRPTALIGNICDFQVIVLDDRPEFASKERFPNAETRITPEYKNCFEDMRLTARDYIVIVTRGHLFDAIVLAQALRTEAGYIGMIGSSRKRSQVYEQLLKEGFTQKDIERVHSPIGVDINAETPEEIAVSIVAQCIACRRGARLCRG